MSALAREPGGTGCAVEVAGDDVPADTSLGEVVQRGHTACKQIGRLIAQVGGNPKAEVLGHAGHGRNQQHRVIHGHLHRTSQGRIRAGAQHVIHAHDIGKKQAVKQTGFQPLGVVGPVGKFKIAA